MAEHYEGDDTEVRTLGAGVVAAFADITVVQIEADADAFLRHTGHPTLGRGYLDCAYAPMVELLAYTPDEHGGAITRQEAADYLQPATPTATSRCSTSPANRTSRSCSSWCCTTTPSASSST